MPRQRRFSLPGIPQHVIQRGNNRKACFFTDHDRETYLQFLIEAAASNECDVHAYVLMTNHVHLLATPGVEHGIPKMMQSLGRRYVQTINRRHRRSGTLWEGRYKATVVSSDDFLLRCYRYIELNPVRAGIVARAADYPWSSFHENALGASTGIVSAHSVYQALGVSPGKRRTAYRDLVSDGLSDPELKELREATRRGWPFGRMDFYARIESMLNQSIPRNGWGGSRQRRKS